MRHSSQSNFSTRIIALGVLTRKERPHMEWGSAKSKVTGRIWRRHKMEYNSWFPAPGPWLFISLGSKGNWHFSFIHLSVCPCVCKCTHVCIYKGQRTTWDSNLGNDTHLLLMQSLLLALAQSWPIRLGWLPSKPQGLYFPSAEITSDTAMPGIVT